MSLFIYFLFEMRVISHQHFYLAEKGTDAERGKEIQMGVRTDFPLGIGGFSAQYNFYTTLARYRGMEKPSLEEHFVYPNFLELS